MDQKPHAKRINRITIADVARLANVSTTTVSFVLNRTPGQTISLGTRIRVFEASQELGYLPNPNARALGKGVSNEIAQISFEPDKSYGLVEWLKFTQQRTIQLGYTPATYLSYGSSPEAMFDAYLHILARRPVGVITTKLLMTQEIYALTKATGLRNCLVFNPTPLDYVPTIIMPYQELGRLVGAHFLERGHQRIAFIKPIPSSPSVLRQEISHECLIGIQSVFSRRENNLFEFPMDTTIESARETVGKILDCPEKPTAVFGFTDEYCLPLHKAFQERRICMPEQIALVGLEDSVMADYVQPALTTVRFDVQAFTFRMVDRMDALIRNQKFPAEMLSPIPVELIVRESS